MSILVTKNDTTHQIAFHYNTIIKTYANNEKKIKHTTYSVSKGLSKEKSRGVGGSQEDKEYQRYKNLYQTKQNIIDLAYHNGLETPWEYFITLTFDDHKVNAKDYNQVSSELAKWIDNMKHQNPNMEYIMAPEPHPTSGRVHFHGIFKNVPKWVLIEAKNPQGRLIKKNGVQIYNLMNYKLGFTTVSKVQDQEAISVYISKYITKELIDLAYKKRYWSSKSLKRPNIEYAYFNEEELSFYIDKEKIKKEHRVDKENCTSIFYTIIS